MAPVSYRCQLSFSHGSGAALRVQRAVPGWRYHLIVPSSRLASADCGSSTSARSNSARAAAVFPDLQIGLASAIRAAAVSSLQIEIFSASIAPPARPARR